MAKWQKGQSGNPNGKPKGSGKLGALRDEIEKALPDVITKLIEQAKAGDMQAAKLLVERVLPPVKATDQLVHLDLSGAKTLTDKANAILNAIAAGEISPSQGTALIAAVSGVTRVDIVDEPMARLARQIGR